MKIMKVTSLFNSARDKNQENFENIKVQMMKKEGEYAQVLSNIANDLNIRNSRKKSLETKENLAKHFKVEDDSNLKSHLKKLKLDQLESHGENLQEKLQNLQYKFQKLEEFTEQSNVESFCKKFKKNAQKVKLFYNFFKNFDLFLTISMISKQAKQLEKEIKDFEDEIGSIKKFKSGQQGVEKNNLLNELVTKTQKLQQKADRYEAEYKKKAEEFKGTKNNIYSLYMLLECEKEVNADNLMLMESGVNENNVRLYMCEIENKLKMMQRYYEMERMAAEDLEIKKIDSAREKPNPKQVADNMKIAFASMGKNNKFLLYRNF